MKENTGAKECLLIEKNGHVVISTGRNNNALLAATLHYWLANKKLQNYFGNKKLETLIADYNDEKIVIKELSVEGLHLIASILIGASSSVGLALLELNSLEESIKNRHRETSLKLPLEVSEVRE